MNGQRWRSGLSRRRRRAAGQVVPVIAAALVVAGVLGVGLVHLAAGAARVAAAQAAADAAALAGAAQGPDAAERLAAANGARLVSYEVVGLDVRVVVIRGDARASARARWVATPPGLAADDAPHVLSGPDPARAGPAGRPKSRPTDPGVRTSIP